MIYVLGDEKDLLRLRTNFRKEEVFLYPTTLKKEEVCKVFDVIIERINSIANRPEFYDTLSQNCLTSLAADFRKVIKAKSNYDYRRILSGYSDEALFENGRIDSKLSFKETRQLHYINQYLQDDINGDNYSRKIRPHLKDKFNQGIQSK